MVDEYQLIKESNLFDETWFREKYSIDNNTDSIIFFLENYEKLELDPSPQFNTKYYLNENIDVKNAGINPLVHYILYGKNESRLPTPYLFDPKYKQDYAIIYNSNLFDETWFREKYSINSNINPIIFFLENYEKLELNPSPTFDVKKYLKESNLPKNNPMNPFAHYIKYQMKKNTDKVKIGLLGCCLSRDAFTTKMNPNYKDFFEIVAEATRVSIISLMQKPMQINEESFIVYPINPGNNFATKCMINDKKKTFLNELKETEIDYLIIDNYLEVAFGIICFDEEIITYDDNLESTEFYKELTEYTHIKIMDSPDEYFEMWSKNCDNFFDFLKKECPNLNIILHNAKPYDKFLKQDGTIYTDTTYTSHCKMINPYLSKLNEYIKNNFDVRVIEYDEIYYLDENHMWGKGPEHYNKKFYEDFLYKLKKIIIEDYYREISYLSHVNLELIKNNSKLIKEYNELLKNKTTDKIINNLEQNILKKDINFFKQQLYQFEAEIDDIKTIIQSMKEDSDNY